MSPIRGYVRRGSRGRWHKPVRYGASKSVIYVACGRVLTGVERATSADEAHRCEKCVVARRRNGVDRMVSPTVL